MLRVPSEEDLYSKSSSFMVDAAVRALLNPRSPRSPRLHARIPSEAHAIYIGRRAVECAAGMAIAALEQVEAGQHADEWRQARDLYRDAAKSLRRALQFVSRERDWHSKPTNERLQAFPDCGPEPLLPAMVQYYRRALRNEDEGRSEIRERMDNAAKLASRGANALFEADALLHELSHHAGLMEAQIRDGRLYPGQPQKIAFVGVFAEAWMFLTGRRPGKQPSNNPFSEFVLAGWEDCGGDKDENFERTVRDVTDALPAILDPTTDDYPRPIWLR